MPLWKAVSHVYKLVQCRVNVFNCSAGCGQNILVTESRSSCCFIHWPHIPLLTHTWCIRTRPEWFHFSVWWERVCACSLHVCIGFPWISVLIKWSAWTTDMGTVFQSTLSTDIFPLIFVTFEKYLHLCLSLFRNIKVHIELFSSWSLQIRLEFYDCLFTIWFLDCIVW